MHEVPRALAVLSLLALVPGCGVLFGSDRDPDMDASDEELPPDEEPGAGRPVEEPFEGDCLPAEWTAADPGTASGIDLELALTGWEVRVDGMVLPTVARVEGPGTLRLLGPSLSIAVFEGADVNGTYEGLLVVTGDSLQLAAGAFLIEAEADTSLDDDAIAIRPLPSPEDDGTRPTLPGDAPAGHAVALEQSSRFDVAAQELAIVGYDSAYIVHDDGSWIELNGALTVSSTRMYAAYETTVYGSVANVAWSGPAVIGLSPTEGEAFTEDGPLAALPSVVLATSPTLRVGPGLVETIDPIRTQVALDDHGAVLASGVELRACEPRTLVMYPGQTRTLQLAYRQTDPPTDAVFADFRIEEANGVEWSARIETVSEIPAPLTAASEGNADTSWGQGFIDFAEAWVELTRAFGRAATCVFTFGFVCPDNDGGGSDLPDLQPYPGWMAARAHGTFEVEMTAPPDSGDYDVVVRIDGDNYTSSVDFHVIVAP